MWNAVKRFARFGKRARDGLPRDLHPSLRLINILESNCSVDEAPANPSSDILMVRRNICIVTLKSHLRRIKLSLSLNNKYEEYRLTTYRGVKIQAL